MKGFVPKSTLYTCPWIGFRTPAHQRPTTNDQRPTTNDQRPTTNDQQPTIDNNHLPPSNQQPTLPSQHMTSQITTAPATSSHCRCGLNCLWLLQPCLCVSGQRCLPPQAGASYSKATPLCCPPFLRWLQRRRDGDVT
jgi:hypothetical protein